MRLPGSWDVLNLAEEPWIHLKNLKSGFKSTNSQILSEIAKAYQVKKCLKIYDNYVCKLCFPLFDWKLSQYFSFYMPKSVYFLNEIFDYSSMCIVASLMHTCGLQCIALK